jgi:hypothetical protein
MSENSLLFTMKDAEDFVYFFMNARLRTDSRKT